VGEPQWWEWDASQGDGAGHSKVCGERAWGELGASANPAWHMTAAPTPAPAQPPLHACYLPARLRSCMVALQRSNAPACMH
jgi:hypothetical protein